MVGRRRLRPASTGSSSILHRAVLSSRPSAASSRRTCSASSGERVVAQLRGELFGRLVTLSLDFHGQHRVGELVSRLSSDVTLVRTMLTQTVTSLLSSVIGLVGSVIILFTLSPTLLLVVLLLAPALIAVAIVFGRPLQRVSTQVQDTIAQQHDDGRGGAVRDPRGQELRPRGLGARALRRGPAGRSSPTGSRLALWRAAFGALMGFLGFGAIAGLLWYTGHQVIEGALGIGTLTGFLLYGVAIGGEPRHDRRAVRPVPGGDRARSPGCSRSSTPGRPSSMRPDARPIGPVAGRIELDGVSFAYEPEPAGPARHRRSTSGQGRPSPWSGRRDRARRRSSGSSRGCGT